MNTFDGERELKLCSLWTAGFYAWHSPLRRAPFQDAHQYSLDMHHWSSASKIARTRVHRAELSLANAEEEGALIV